MADCYPDLEKACPGFLGLDIPSVRIGAPSKIRWLSDYYVPILLLPSAKKKKIGSLIFIKSQTQGFCFFHFVVKEYTYIYL